MANRQCAAAREAAAAYAAFHARMDVIAKRYRAKYLIPFCDKHNVKFIAGMGGYSFLKEDWQHVFGEWDAGLKLPKRLQEVLEVPYGSGQHNDLGSMMADYTPKNFKEKKP